MFDLVLEDFELYSPVVLRGRKLTDAEFLLFCAKHEDLRVESNASGEVELMPGTGPRTGRRNMAIAGQLQAWTKHDRRGLAFDSSTLFVLPNGARRSPDASWIDHARIGPLALSGELWTICPDFVIELRSASDRLGELRAKMSEWIANGARLGWLIDPDTRSVLIYRPGAGEPEALENPDSLAGEGPVAGFQLDLSEIWA